MILVRICISTSAGIQIQIQIPIRLLPVLCSLNLLMTGAYLFSCLLTD